MRNTPITPTSSCMSSIIAACTQAKSFCSAQMDATENDIPPSAPFRVQGFPTLKFRPAGSSEFIDYTGDRSLDSLVEFVETHRKSDADVAEEEWEEEDEAPEHDEL